MTASSHRDGHDGPALLRAHGLRVTPQRRAILEAFRGGATEHLSAEEVHARAALAVPEIGRGTVYATLAELAELGLVGAVGSSEPVRFETNVEPHQHFRCRLCLRLYDVPVTLPPTAALAADGFVVDSVTVLVEGVCADCGDYDRGLTEGAARSGEDGHALAALPRGVAYGRAETPLGAVQMLCTDRGAARVMYADHAQGPEVAAAGARRRGSAEARARLDELTRTIDAYFAHGTPIPADLPVDWEAAAPAGPAATLTAVRAIPFGGDRSYELLDATDDAFARGVAVGSNPLALVIPCHRVSRGRERPAFYVGGPERKHALLAHEQQHAAR